jgi:hypothetical protein
MNCKFVPAPAVQSKLGTAVGHSTDRFTKSRVGNVFYILDFIETFRGAIDPYGPRPSVLPLPDELSVGVTKVA